MSITSIERSAARRYGSDGDGPRVLIVDDEDGGRAPRVVLMTAAGPAARALVDTGADAVLRKPLTVDEVLGLAASLLWRTAASAA